MPILLILCASSTSTVNGVVVSSGSILPEPFSSIGSFVLAILALSSIYRIYSKVSEKAVVMMVFTVLTCGLLAPIFLFAIRNNEVIA